MRKDPADLSRRINYKFTRQEFLDQALTHRSARKKNNERLEFLGDSILSLVITGYLFNEFENAQEGELSRLRSSLVKGEKLAELARKINLGDYMVLGTGELKSGGFRRSSILADTLEAVMGAVYLDSDFERCRKVILALYEDELINLSSSTSFKDNKTQIQEYLQSRQLPLPKYRVVELTGNPHDQTFIVECAATGLDMVITGTGSSRRRAEQHAASRILEKIKDE
ncbi:MAG TPA: ribonuclease III [Gammaproteobacteria bacterium]|nr:ribonuclease III [Gammaproteobacteria bacterium]